ncbi:hypothetical protein K503DRAFT_796600 [Rhizopogon vinicolor AM-OR11-026]|uniref:Uncharacterized protein n=1 Tax=Rhizopogon vinicolor AM-OR11-026 TaxID=1314800 RepID=A0A1B7NDV2_9AGAM|nr:hypothetical protein K503DRAFT_796600 [Rhizopogon vinicolor AM-OR11-026]
MSYLSRNMSDDDEEPIIEVSIPGPNASKGDLIEAMKVLQVQVQKLVEDNRSLREENKILIAEKPKRKRRGEPPEELVVHEQTITLHARKYGMTVEMFPNSDLLNKTCPEDPTLFNSCDRYLTAMTQESAFLDELYHHFPNGVHCVMESTFFSDIVMKSISEARSSEINKLRGVAGDIFGLPGMYFTNINYPRASVTEIQEMLGVSATNPRYKIFPPVLFTGMCEDPSLKTVFGNCELLGKILKAALHGVTSLHQAACAGGSKTNARKWNLDKVTPGSIAWASVIAIFLLSPDSEFQKSGVGKTSGINYKVLFFQYKKLLIIKWDNPRIQTIVQSINCQVFGAAKASISDSTGQEDFSNEINRAMLALDMDSDSQSDTSAPSSTQGVNVSPSQADTDAQEPPEHAIPTLSAIGDTASVMQEVDNDTADNNMLQNVVQGQPASRGKGRTRAKKPVAQGTRRGTRLRQN